ncbi:DUF5684 domain-containing protein [bacterium]|nr:DUF5684 domain-containing protein [bacterium]
MEYQFQASQGPGVLQIVLMVVFYLYFAYCLWVIGKKTNTPNEWMAWVPLLNIYYMCVVAGKPAWWLIFFLIPLVNIIFAIIVWMAIARVRNKPAWLGVLIIVPIANLVVPAYIAFSD